MLCLTETMFSNYTDDSNLFGIGKDINEVEDTLLKDIGTITNEKLMVSNFKKCNFICIGRDRENEIFTFKDVCYEKQERSYFRDNY